MNDFLSEVEKNAIVAFNANTVMSDAVKKVIMHTITHQGTMEAGKPAVETNWVFGLGASQINGVLSNEQMGEELKAALKGLGYLQDGFKKLLEVSVPMAKEKKVNPAV